MQYGKISVNAFDRSIHKVISPRRTEVLQGVHLGNHCSVLSSDGTCDGAIVVSENPVSAPQGAHFSAWLTAGFYRCMNDVAVMQATPTALRAVMLLPGDCEEPQLRSWIELLEQLCEKENLEYMGGHTETLYHLENPIVVLSVYGLHPDVWKADGETGRSEEISVKQLRRRRGAYMKQQRPRAGQAIVMTGYAGAETAALLAQTLGGVLEERFSTAFLDLTSKMLEYMNCVPEAAVAGKHGVTAMHNISSGGVMGALWEMSHFADLGFDVDLRKIPIRQETIEICEFFGLNPYQISSCGAMLMASDTPDILIAALEGAGIPACQIGIFQKDRACRLLNEEETRFLERPAEDAVQCLLKRYQSYIKRADERERIEGEVK